MKYFSFAVLALFFGLAVAELRYKLEDHYINPDILSHIEENAQTWKAASLEQNKFAHMPMSDIKRMLGLKGMEKDVIRKFMLKHRDDISEDNEFYL